MTTPPIPPPRSRPPRRTRAASGEEVLRQLLEVAPAGLTRTALLERLEQLELNYSPSQVANGTVWVKEVGASREGRPFAWSRKNGSGFPDDPQDWVEYELSQGRRAYTVLDRLLKSTVDPHLQRLPDDPTVRDLHKRFNNAAREIGIALEELKHPPPPATPASV